MLVIFDIRPLAIALPILACAHGQPLIDRSAPPVALGCFDLFVARAPPGRRPLPNRIRLSPERAACPSAHDRFTVVSLAGPEAAPRFHGHWSSVDGGRRIMLDWSTDYFGVAFDLERTAGDAYRGRATSFQCVGNDRYESAAELVPAPC